LSRQAVPELLNVVLLLFFIFIIFGILGVQLFAGQMNTRCRLTPYPVTLDYADALAAISAGSDVAPDPRPFACAIAFGFADANASESELAATNYDQPGDCASSAIGYPCKADSNWATPRACYWPVAQQLQRFCAFPGVGGAYECPSGPHVGPEAQTWCGADFDAFGNPRFTGTGGAELDIDGVVHGMDSDPYSAAPRAYGRGEVNSWFVRGGLNTAGIYNEGMNWGLTNFDNMGRAFLTIFQSITLEGWSDIMYFVQDSTGWFGATLYFVVLILFGGFFALNLVLAVLEGAFDLDDDDAPKEEGAEGEEGDADAGDAAAAPGGDDTGGHGAMVAVKPVGGGRGGGGEKQKKPHLGELILAKLPEGCMEGTPAYAFIMSDKVSIFFTSLIILNTAVLASDFHEAPLSWQLQVGGSCAVFVFPAPACLPSGWHHDLSGAAGVKLCNVACSSRRPTSC